MPQNDSESQCEPLTSRTLLSEHRGCEGLGVERRVQKLAKANDLSCYFVASKGKGSHGRLYLGPDFTTLKDRKKELGKGLLVKMCRDLNIRPGDL
jgi:hypothetical protein